jgi:hypothetical protein
MTYFKITFNNAYGELSTKTSYSNSKEQATNEILSYCPECEVLSVEVI